MANIILIDGIDFSSSIIGTEDLTVSFAKDTNTGTVTAAISSDLTFVRDSYEYLKAKFFDVGVQGRNEESTIAVINDCCETQFDLLVRGDAVVVCFEKCQITGQAFSRPDDLVLADQLAGNPIFTELDIHPKMRSCTYFGFGQGILYAFLLPFVVFMEALGTVLGFLGLDGFTEIARDLQKRSVGCTSTIPVFYNKRILDDSLGAIGLTLSSSIFETEPYNNSVFMAPTTQVIEGAEFNTIQETELLPLESGLTVLQYLQLIEVPFNADFRIKDGVLFFEREDFFLENLQVLVNVEEVRAEGESEIPCYSYTNEVKYAFARFQYQNDSIDEAGNRSRVRLYNDIVEWNDPFNPQQRGEKEVEVGLGAAAFVSDGFNNATLDSQRPFGRILVKGQLREYPKIIVIQERSSSDTYFEDAFAISQNSPSGSPGNGTDFNYPMWFEENYPDDELYNNFWSICDPRVAPAFPYELDEFSFRGTCEQIELIKSQGIDLIIETRLGRGRAEEITISLNDKIITLKGVKIEA